MSHAEKPLVDFLTQKSDFVPRLNVIQARIFEVLWDSGLPKNPPTERTYHLVGISESALPVVSSMIMEYNFSNRTVVTISDRYKILDFNKDPYEMAKALENWYTWNQLQVTLNYTDVTDLFII